jgi:hypothetical protein
MNNKNTKFIKKISEKGSEEKMYKLIKENDEKYSRFNLAISKFILNLNSIS